MQCVYGKTESYSVVNENPPATYVSIKLLVIDEVHKLKYGNKRNAEKNE